MSEAIFTGADLTGTNMDSADTTDTQFQGAIGIKA